MQIKLLVPVAQPHGVLPWNVGDEVEVTEAEGNRMIASRFGLPIETTAKAGPPETRQRGPGGQFAKRPAADPAPTPAPAPPAEAPPATTKRKRGGVLGFLKPNG